MSWAWPLKLGIQSLDCQISLCYVTSLRSKCLVCRNLPTDLTSQNQIKRGSGGNFSSAPGKSSGSWWLVPSSSRQVSRSFQEVESELSSLCPSSECFWICHAPTLWGRTCPQWADCTHEHGLADYSPRLKSVSCLFCRTHKLRVIFTFFLNWKKLKEESYFVKCKDYVESKFQCHRVLLEQSQLHLFVCCL